MRERVRWLALFGALAIGGVLVFAVLAVQVTSTPSFCGSCHIMRPYYESWKTSSHNHIACVECHIPPGLGSEVRKKYEALSMVARYLTGTYSTNPWAEVEDAACLRCHEKRLVQGRVIFHNVVFDHTPHLTELRRGKRLRCTSCHSQMVQGTHIRVTPSTCFLCHFKDVKVGRGVARCTLCHTVPDSVVTSEGFRFDHKRVKSYGMACTWCHAGSVQGTGDVPRERCITCHNRPDAMNLYRQPVRLHEIHVTEHKVECLNCHEEIRHGRMRRQPVATACQACHLTGHAVTRELYAGLGGQGVPPRPDPMYLAGTGCEGCHFLEDSTRSGPLKRASEVSCMACHGPGFKKVYKGWQQTLARALQRTRKAVAQARPYRHRIPDWSKVVENLRLVERGQGIHNVGYSLELLRWSYEKIRETRVFPLEPWPEEDVVRPGCRSCHLNMASQEARVGNAWFRHRTHLERMNGDCGVCHRPHGQKPRGEVLRPGKDCVQCHHQPSRLKKGCTLCHREIPDTLRLGSKMFPHAYHVGEDVELMCEDCHQQEGWKASSEVCAECHD